MRKLEDRTDEAAEKGMVKFANSVKNLAQLKIKADKHIVTSRLRNSIAVQSSSGVDESSYSDNEGDTYQKSLNVQLNDNEFAVGSNVDYAAKIELQDSYLYYAVKHADVDKLSMEIAKGLKLKL